jgi:hypothetical protein
VILTGCSPSGPEGAGVKGIALEKEEVGKIIKIIAIMAGIIAVLICRQGNTTNWI